MDGNERKSTYLPMVAFLGGRRLLRSLRGGGGGYVQFGGSIKGKSVNIPEVRKRAYRKTAIL